MTIKGVTCWLYSRIRCNLGEENSVHEIHYISQHGKQCKLQDQKQAIPTFKQELRAVNLSSGVPNSWKLFSPSSGMGRNLGVFGSEGTNCDLPVLELIGERTSRWGF